MIQIAGESFSQKALVERAHQLLGRGGPFPPEECKVLGACWPIIRERPIQSLEDARLHRAAKAHHVVEPEKPEPAPTPYDEAITAAASEAAEKKEKFEELHDTWVDAQRALEDMKRKQQPGSVPYITTKLKGLLMGGPEIEAASERERTAWRARERAEMAFRRANSKLGELQRRASDWRVVESHRQQMEIQRAAREEAAAAESAAVIG